ncbi:MAG: hypothetical protein AB7S56_06165 [Halothiobacillaceae bacterium]
MIHNNFNLQLHPIFKRTQPMQRILNEDTWQQLQNDIQQLIELNAALKQHNQQLLEDKNYLLNLVTRTEERLVPVLEQLLIQQDDPA